MHQRVFVPANYRCPFCPDHCDDVFVASRLARQPICEGCSHELAAFCDEEERRNHRVITAVEQHTNLPWRACQCILLHYELQLWKGFRIAPPAWFMEGTTETVSLTKNEAVAQIDEQIERVQRLIDRFEQSLPQHVREQIQFYVT